MGIEEESLFDQLGLDIKITGVWWVELLLSDVCLKYIHS